VEYEGKAALKGTGATHLQPSRESYGNPVS